MTPDMSPNMTPTQYTYAKPPGYMPYDVHMSQCHIPTCHHTMSICHNVTYQHVGTSGFTRVVWGRYDSMSHIDIFCCQIPQVPWDPGIGTLGSWHWYPGSLASVPWEPGHLHHHLHHRGKTNIYYYNYVLIILKHVYLYLHLHRYRY